MQTLPLACLPVCWQGYSAQLTLSPDCLTACVLAMLFCPGYSAQATAHPATSLPACLLARLLCPGYCTPCHLPVRCLGYSAKATEHPASVCLFPGQATLPRLMHTLPPACLPVCQAQATLPRLLHTLPPACLPSLLARLLCPGYCTSCHLPVKCPVYSAQATEHPASCLPVSWPGYSAKANAHPANCLPALFAGKATLLKATAHPADCLIARLLARLLCPANLAALLPACLRAGKAVLPRLLYCTPCHLPACMFAGKATMPRLLDTLPPAC